MEADKVNLFISTKGDYFPSESLPMIRERLEHLDPACEMSVMATSYLNPLINLAVSFFIGELGVDRFLIGQVGAGIGKLLLTMCCGAGLVWWFIDLFLIMGATKKRNLEKFMLAAGA